MFINTSSIFVLIIFAASLRIIPHIFSPQGAGVDHWFWKKYIETYRNTRQFPPVLPQYLLDQFQWYPPLFPLVMAKIPSKMFDKWNHLLAITVDLSRMFLLLCISLWLTNGDTLVLVLAGLIYATSPIQISYNFQLNPRCLAALFLDISLILLLWFYSYHGPWWVWFFVIFMSGLILLTHKMTTQLFWFICICCSIIYKDITLLLLIPASVLTALILSKGFYLKVLIAHWDIIRFWKAHWRWIGADVIRESPVYGNTSYQRSQKLHQTGLKGYFWYAIILFGFNPASWIACLLIFERIFTDPHLLIYSSWLILWLLVPCILAIITTLIPLLRCIGAGYLYLYNTSLITSLLLAMAFRYTKSPNLSTLVYCTAFLTNILGVLLFYSKFFKNKRARIDQTFTNILNTLKSLPQGTVWCIPSGWHEPVAYKTQHSVLWGAHGYGFKLLTPTFPRLLITIDEMIKRYNVRYLLTIKDSLLPKCLSDMPQGTRIIQEKEYLLYIFPN